MESKVIEMNICGGTCDCCIHKVYASMKAYPRMWKEMEDMIVADTPLHEAAAAGNTAVAAEILNLVPPLGRKLNGEGMSPLHLAIEGGHRKTVEMLVGTDASLVRVKGREGETPLMLCAGKEYMELLATLLLACPQSVNDVNNRRETVVHVALRKGNSEAVLILVAWLERTDQVWSILYAKDANGDTALHAAARFGCVEGTKKLVKLVELNRVNLEGKTALDIAYECSSPDKVVQVLKEKQARRANEMASIQTIHKYVLSPTTPAEFIFRRLYYLTNMKITPDMRGAILVVATVIFTVTYQGVMQPPGGLYPAPQRNATATTVTEALPTTGHQMPTNSQALESEMHLAGQMVMRESYYRNFVTYNTFTFALSAVIIIFVVPVFRDSPIYSILHLCLFFMCITYLLALRAVSYYTGIYEAVLFMALYAICGAYLVKLSYHPVKTYYVREDWWLRSLISVWLANLASRSRWGSGKLGRVAERMKMQNRVLATSSN